MAAIAASILAGGVLACASTLTYKGFEASCYEHNWAVTRVIRHDESRENCDVVENIRTRALLKDAAGAMAAHAVLGTIGTSYIMHSRAARLIPTMVGVGLAYCGILVSKTI